MPSSFSAANERKAMAINHFKQQLFPTARLLASMVALCFAGIAAASAMALISWIVLARLGF
jgi:predicted protein tyrosine phosphatase